MRASASWSTNKPLLPLLPDIARSSPISSVAGPGLMLECFLFDEAHRLLYEPSALHCRPSFSRLGSHSAALIVQKGELTDRISEQCFTLESGWSSTSRTHGWKRASG
jgi:hypothetical protein